MNFFLLILGIPLDISLKLSKKQCQFSKTLLEKSFEFISSSGDDIITFYMCFMLLPAEVDSILKEQSYKNDVLVVCGTGFVEIVFVVLTKVIALYK